MIPTNAVTQTDMGGFRFALPTLRNSIEHQPTGSIAGYRLTKIDPVALGSDGPIDAAGAQGGDEAGHGGVQGRGERDGFLGVGVGVSKPQ